MNFVGTVRVKDKNNKNILSMTLEHYPVMTENEILKITEKALKKWDINYISIIHRIGKLFPKDKIVYVGVSSKHRQNAFNACNFITVRLVIPSKKQSGFGVYKFPSLNLKNILAPVASAIRFLQSNITASL